ncbi:MAG: amino acid transport protein [Candidatus Wallbacteria bacterium]|nr:amino acid transport protein [Candidatus Wallbacteria bacterium]
MTILVLGFFISLVGMGYFMYGRSSQNFLALLCGACMMAYPYFISSPLWMIILFVSLLALPFLFRDY